MPFWNDTDHATTANSTTYTTSATSTTSATFSLTPSFQCDYDFCDFFTFNSSTISLVF